jgi:tRNA threonylcarbamoyladenosine biosynthesis protein TsaE
MLDRISFTHDGDPMPFDLFSVAVDSPEQTAIVAAALSRRLTPGDVVLMTGDLASGKTTFVKGVVTALGSADLVTSPTFTLAQFYSTDLGQVLHIDAYRLSGVPEFRDLGLEEYIEESIVLVEWGEKLLAEFSGYLTIDFAVDSDSRVITFSSVSPRWTNVLEDLRDSITEDIGGTHARD